MPVTRTRLRKVLQYARPHDWNTSFYLQAEAETKNSTILPIIMQDEGLGAPSALATNPENASFTGYGGENCFVDSEVNKTFTELTFTLTKGAIETDKIHALTMAFMPISIAFPEDYDITDEVSTATIKGTLELTKETTDRQGFPLYTGTKLAEKFAGSATMQAGAPGLTTTQVLESVAFDHEVFYDAIHYLKISEKIKTLVGGLNWITLTKTRPTKRILIKNRPGTKRMNPYTFHGVLIHLPIGDSHKQMFDSGDTSVIDHVLVQFRCRFNEWNQEFDFGRV